jgi:II/X family phage/plasmid replication protein
MLDKYDIRIPFKADKVKHLAGSTLEKPLAYVNFEDYSFPMHAPDVEIIDGKPVIKYFKNRDWDSISSGIAGMAVGFFPQGQGLHTYPTVSIKASPAKILQGHNVFGAESSKQGIVQMFAMLKMAFPDIYEDLEISDAEIRYVDCTYSACIREFFSAKIFFAFESMATARQKINKNTGYCQLGQGSERERAKLYKKLQEVLADLEDAKKKRNTYRVDILSDQRLLDFATDLHRFEATLGARKLQSLGIPTNVVEYLKFEDWFVSVHKIPLCRYMWGLVFNPIFSQFEGHKVKNVDDSNIKLQIDAKFIRIKDNGKICKRKATAIFKTYREIKSEGYATLLKQNNQTFFRNVNYLQEAGISKAFLKTLDPNKPTTNVISFPQIIKIDFGLQRPDWFVEPMAHFECDSRLLRLVG